jgi:amino acid permease (GABA permease)
MTTPARQARATGVAPGADRDSQQLNALGYAQELRRSMGWFSNFAVSFSIISILTGGITTYYLGMDAGGPRAITLGWIIVGALVLCIGASMAEICSAYPTAGGLYYWSAKLARGNKASWSWATGWFNLVGQVAVTASIDYGLATYVAFLIGLYADSFAPTVHWILLIYAGVLAVHGALNTFRVRLVALLSTVSVWWHVAGTVVIVVALLAIPSHHQAAGFLLHSKNLTGWTGPLSGSYAFLIGLLLSQYTLTGYDASAHMSEETQGADRSGPRAIVRAIYVSIIAAFILNLSMTLALQGGSANYDKVAALGPTAGAEIFLQAVSGAGGKLLVIICVIAQFFCGLASVTANSRMIYAFSRDGAVPGHRLWHRINPRTRTPTNSVWFAAIGAFVLGLPSLYQHKGVSVVFFAIVSIGTVGLYISYVLPVFLRLRLGRDFVPGPWSLGRWSRLIGVISVIWVVVITVLFFAPAFYPWKTLVDFNFAGPVFVLILGAVFLWYGLSARKWFTGPKVQGTPEELAAIERDLMAGG